MGHFDKAIEMHEHCLAIMKKVGDCKGQTDLILIFFPEVSYVRIYRRGGRFEHPRQLLSVTETVRHGAAEFGACEGDTSTSQRPQPLGSRSLLLCFTSSWQLLQVSNYNKSTTREEKLQLIWHTRPTTWRKRPCQLTKETNQGAEAARQGDQGEQQGESLCA